MEEKKTCFKCGKEFPRTEEYFSKNSGTNGGFEGQCKQCRKKYFRDYRAGRKIRAGSGKAPSNKDTATKRPYHRLPAQRALQPGGRDLKKIEASEPLTKATPAEILIALRKGMAAEIVAMIKEKYNL